MRKYAYIILLALIASAVYFTSCDRVPKMMEPLLPDAEQVEPPPEMVETPPETTPEQGLGIFDCAVLPGHGLRAEGFYPGTPLTQLPDFDTLTPFLIWSVACIDVPHRSYTDGFPGLGLDVLEHFAIRMRGQIEIETAGTYNFKIKSDDGAQLYINDALIVDNDGLQSFTTATGSVVLDAGLHDVELQYFQGPRTEIGLQWFWQPPDGAEAIVPPEVLYPPPPEMVVETPAESPPEMVETPPETPPMVEMEPSETTDLHGGMVDIEDAMSTVGLRKIYWIYVDGSSLLRANPDGSGVETLFHGRPDLEPAFGVRKLVLDGEGGKIYWNGDVSAHRGGGVWRANLDGTNLERLTTTQARSFALDLEAGKIYWVTYDGEHMFHRSNLDGSNVEKFKTRAIFGQPPSMIAFDPVDRKIYAPLWDYPGVSAINTDDLDITSADIEFQLPISPKNLTLDIEERKIYWVTDYSGVYRMNLDGTNHELLLDEGRIAATFDFNTRKIYWASRERGWGGGAQIIWQTNLDGSGTEGLFAVKDSISGIAVEVGPTN